MTDPVMDSIQAVRAEAMKLEAACRRITAGGTLLHIAFDRDLAQEPSLSEAVIMGRLGGMK